MPRHPDTVTGPNRELQRARRALPSPARDSQCMSRSELATAVNALLHSRKAFDVDVDATYIGKLEAGATHWVRDDRRRRAIRDVLGAESDAELGFYPTRHSRVDAALDSLVGPLGGASPPIPPLSGQRSHSGAEMASDVSFAWLGMFDSLSTTVNSQGWTALHPMVSAQLRSLDLARQRETREAPGLAFADARWSEFMSWICDNGGFGEGGNWLARAYTRSLEADDPVFAAYVLMRQSQRALDNGDAREAVALSRKALEGDGLPPRTQALCLTRLAEGLALAGDDESLELAATAHGHAEPADDQPADMISRHCDRRYVSAAQARCRYLLGDHHEAAAILEDILTDDRPAGELDTGMWTTYLADSYVSADPEHAAATGSEALDLARRTGSARITRALLPLAVTLRPHRHHESVGRFVAEHRQVLTALVQR